MASNESLQPQAIALIFLFPSLASTAVLLRVYVRTTTRTFAIDDWVICGALVSIEQAVLQKMHLLNNHHSSCTGRKQQPHTTVYNPESDWKHPS